MRLVKLKFCANKSGCRAFSLVEVVIAIGIFAISVLTILVLLSVSMEANRSASSDTQVALMAERTYSMLESLGFQNVSTNKLFASGASPNLYFDVTGKPLMTSTNTVLFGYPPPANALAAGAIYSCTVTTNTPPLSFGSAGGNSTNLLSIGMKFAWPAAAPTANQTVRIVNATLGNYD
jgi:type II secretory pathway pseudopilin PulG